MSPEKAVAEDEARAELDEADPGLEQRVFRTGAREP